MLVCVIFLEVENKLIDIMKIDQKTYIKYVICWPIVLSLVLCVAFLELIWIDK